MSSTTLKQLIDHYVGSHDVSDGYARLFHWLRLSLEQMAQRVVEVSDLNVDFVNHYLKTTRDTLSPETRKGRRRLILTLWQAAADEGLLPDPPRRKIMAIKVPERLHRAWTAAEVSLLLVAAGQMRGYYDHGIARAAYWRSYVLAAWDSGLRGCDMRRIRRTDIQSDGRSALVQHKTGRVHRFLLREETVAAIATTFPPDRDLVWPLWGRLVAWRNAAHRLVKQAGLVGTIGQLRHSSGTAVELLYPGRGHEHLGNTRRVFERHYLDADQLARDGVLPPKLL